MNKELWASHFSSLPIGVERSCMLRHGGGMYYIPICSGHALVTSFSSKLRNWVKGNVVTFEEISDLYVEDNV